ncbi:diguanylate cyclase [Gorillibacterium sp. sgz5001074]|uniref:GGDEF domain-containing protein n=1 Tax=Gorillibacterium sp. sgz5001074 TaxID=3446695 RepID=UPI003F66C2AC
MSIEEFDGSNLRLWNRKFLISFWYAVLITALTEELYFTAVGMMTWESQLRYMLLPTGINTAILLLTEVLHRRAKASFPYILLLAANLMASVIISVHHSLDYIQCLLMLPILISTFYYRRSLVIYTSGLSIGAFLSLTWFHPYIRERTNAGEWISMPMILLVSTVIALGVMERGIELLQELRSETKDKENLMIQNVIKDKMVRTDTLTGLYNRAALFEHLEMLLRYTQSEGFPLHVAMLDIDHFKSINDTFGHHIGDVVLKRVAEVIRDGTDPGDFAARYGGEEFTLVFTDRTLKEVLGILEKVRRQMEELVHPELDGRSVTVSIGIHPYSLGMGREQLIGEADACLYQAKRTGRNKIVSH